MFETVDAHLAGVVSQHPARRVCQAARTDGRVEVQHVRGEGPRGAEEESAQRPREERAIFPAEGGDEIVEVDAGEVVEIGCHQKFQRMVS